MAKHLETGRKGEEIAGKYLKSKGYSILESNWRYKRAEIDLIVKDGDILVFVEVKTRSSDYFGKPVSFVNAKKEQYMAEAASAYMEEVNYNWEIRFDVIGILLKEERVLEIEHFQDAFFPGLA